MLSCGLQIQQKHKKKLVPFVSNFSDAKWIRLIRLKQSSHVKDDEHHSVEPMVDLEAMRETIKNNPLGGYAILIITHTIQSAYSS